MNGQQPADDRPASAQALVPGAQLPAIAPEDAGPSRLMSLIAAERRVLAQIASGVPLQEVLTQLVLTLEEQSPVDLRASILLVDESGERLRQGAAPNLSAEFLAAVEGLPVAERSGACGTAAFRREPVYVIDVACDPLTENFREFAEAQQLRACWSTPIRAANGSVLGTIANYYRQPRAPTPEDLEAIAVVAQTAALAIERHRSDMALRESEDHYRHTVELNPQISWTTLPAGQVDRVSPRWKEWTGNDGRGDSWAESVHPDDRLRAVEQWRLALATGEPFDVEYRLRQRNGDYRWIRSRAYPRRDVHGQILRWYGTTEDLHERKLVEAALRESEERLRRITELSPTIIWHGRLDGSVSYLNSYWYDYTGQTPEQALPWGWTEAIHPDDAPALLVAWERARSRREGYRAEARLRRRDGQYRWFLMHADPIYDESGELSGWLGSDVDFDDRRKAEEALRRLNETLEAQVAERTADRNRMWQLSTDVMLVARFDGVITAANPAWKTVLGWSERALIGTVLLDLVHPDDRERTRTEVAVLSQGRTTRRFENRYRHRDGSYRVLSWTAVPDENFIHAVGRDISAEKAREVELLQAQDALRQAQKMDAIGQLTGGIAHDFNNLLTGIGGALDLIRRRLAEQRLQGIEALLDAATQSTGRAAALTHRLLAFARRQSLDTRPTDIGQLIVSLEELLHRTLGENIALQTVIAPGLRTAMTDRHQLESAILNLVINARDAMPRGGELTIEARGTRLCEAFTHEPDSLPPGEYVQISVTDTGEGMTPEVLAKAFEPFFTTKPIGQGTGLGLSMVYGFMKQSGGQVRIYSEPGVGTTVKLFLQPAEQPVQYAQPPAPAPRGAGQSVLVVEDDPAVRMIALEVLAELGYRADQAPDADTALALLDRLGHIDLLITDVGLPGMNGRELADAARARRPDLKVLYMTGYAEGAIARRGFLDARSELITKPFALDALATKIRDMMALPVA
jgi:PAS domain S-box-containing protein